MNRALLAEQENAMGFSPQNEAWIRDEIKSAIDRALKGIKPPSGIRKALFVMREWGVLATAFSFVLALIIFAATQWNAANARLAAQASFQAHTEDRLLAIETSLASLRIARISSTPNDRKSQAEAIEVLITARKESLSLPVTVVQEAGNNFIKASASDPSAWTAALKLVDYRSYLISLDEPVPEGAAEVGETHYLFNVPTGKPMPTAMHALKSPGVPMSQAALLEEIGKPSNPDIKIGDALLLLVGGAITVDNERMRHVILKSVEVHYSGAPIILQDVLFWNCTFVMDNTSPARELGERILASTQVDFTSAELRGS